MFLLNFLSLSLGSFIDNMALPLPAATTRPYVYWVGISAPFDHTTTSTPIHPTVITSEVFPTTTTPMYSSSQRSPAHYNACDECEIPDDVLTIVSSTTDDHLSFTAENNVSAYPEFSPPPLSTLSAPVTPPRQHHVSNH